MKRVLSPSTNMPGLTAGASAVYGAALMIYHVYHHQAAFSVPVALAGISAALSWISRQYVTPVADPKDGNGAPMATAAPAAAPEPQPEPQGVLAPSLSNPSQTPVYPPPGTF